VLKEMVRIPVKGPGLLDERRVLGGVGALGKIPGDQVGRLPAVPRERGEMAGIPGEETLVVVLPTGAEPERQDVERARLHDVVDHAQLPGGQAESLNVTLGFVPVRSRVSWLNPSWRIT